MSLPDLETAFNRVQHLGFRPAVRDLEPLLALLPDGQPMDTYEQQLVDQVCLYLLARPEGVFRDGVAFYPHLSQQVQDAILASDDSYAKKQLEIAQRGNRDDLRLDELH